jgi:similar to spore coat protein
MTGGGELGSIMNNRYGAHETCDLHEVTAFKALCLTKTKTMQALADDDELKRLLQLDTEMSTRQLRELDTLLANALH